MPSSGAATCVQNKKHRSPLVVSRFPVQHSIFGKRWRVHTYSSAITATFSIKHKFPKSPKPLETRLSRSRDHSPKPTLNSKSRRAARVACGGREHSAQRADLGSQRRNLVPLRVTHRLEPTRRQEGGATPALSLSLSIYARSATSARLQDAARARLSSSRLRGDTCVRDRAAKSSRLDLCVRLI